MLEEANSTTRTSSLQCNIAVRNACRNPTGTFGSRAANASNGTTMQSLVASSDSPLKETIAEPPTPAAQAAVIHRKGKGKGLDKGEQLHWEFVIPRGDLQSNGWCPGGRNPTGDGGPPWTEGLQWDSTNPATCRSTRSSSFVSFNPGAQEAAIQTGQRCNPSWPMVYHFCPVSGIDPCPSPTQLTTSPRPAQAAAIQQGKEREHCIDEAWPACRDVQPQ
jgi:hypothetical protein